MSNIVRFAFRWIAYFSSYGIAVATSAAISSILAISFGLYYARATNFPMSTLMLWTIAGGAAVAWIGHSVQFGILNKIGFPGFTRPVLAVNRFITATPDLSIRPDLKENDYHELLRALTIIPLTNAFTAVLSVQLIFAAILVAAELSVKFEPYHYVQGVVMDVMFSFIHGGFCLIIGEIATGSMRAECKRIMHEKGIAFTDRAVTTVRLKLAFFITLFLVTLYVAATLVYYNRDNLQAILIFTLMATVAAVLMAYMIFYLIYSALKDIEGAMDDLKSGGSGLIFTKSIDSEFVKVATGISDAARTIKDYQANLEQKIDERTRELQESLGNVKALKGQQDGDYFLTSLLLKPLTGNYANNRQIKVNIFIRQKKSFEFKTKTNEIGGDICLAHSIRLRGRDYTLFLNGDAMGKSMQGAGGSLVLGAVMQSIVERTKLSPKEQVLYPERWLKAVFLELQKTFESFDGSMLISVIMGLADEKSGFVYFINAEHPWSAIYRDGKAFFIENDLTLRKLGTLGVAMGIRVQTYEMQPGDAFVIGSDGRDDLVLGTDETGARVINEDENLFLRMLETGSGDLEATYNACKETGEISDDFSLISLTYQPEIETREVRFGIGQKITEARSLVAQKNYAAATELLEHAYEVSKDNLHVARALAHIYYKAGKIAEAARYFDLYSEENPGDTQAIEALGSLLLKLGESERAADVLTRLKIRNPRNEKIAGQLARIYK
ncbi:MAG: SpoIIE family protein phosphatase [Spirochaetes bacterium]|nr:SpoIIE family protein phosphatase [Spirochaetota bacterium]MBX3722720.1 SpoIIE family protein phosphatase [Turneriella sp.]